MRRPITRRDGARVVVVAGDEVLLQADTDPGIRGSGWWVTPGGGVDPGEESLQAAVRSLREETGLDVVPADLRGPIASRVVTHGYSDRILIQNEIFYRVEVEPFIPDPAALTQGETERLTAQRWFPIDALPSPLWPAELGQLLSWAGGAPIELGHVEESTVPVIPQELPDDR